MGATFRMSDHLPSERRDASTRPITATAVYYLSERGRKDALVQGISAEARQSLHLTVPPEDVELLHVTPGGAAFLALTPRYETLPDGRYVRFDDPPVFDHVPTADELLAYARAAYTIRQTIRADYAGKRQARDAEQREKKATIAQAFLSDATARPAPNPIPNKYVCWLVERDGRLMKFRHTDPPPGGLVPAEAERRRRADAAVKRAAGQARMNANATRADEKRAAIETWVAEHGTPDQRARFEAGVLPPSEVLRCLTEATLAPIAATYPVYRPIRPEELQARFDADPSWSTVRLPALEFAVEIQESQVTAKPHHWAAIQEIQRAIPGATVVLRRDRAYWKGDPSGRAPVIIRYALRVTVPVGPFTLKRVVAAPAL